MRTPRHIAPVAVTFRQDRPYYNAMERFRGARSIQQGRSVSQKEVIQEGLSKIPGFSELLREEQEAYAKTKRKANQETILDVARREALGRIE